MFLVGMMGAGKSAVGARLAHALGRRFGDVDAAAEALAGEPIAALFAAGEEARFREHEGRALRACIGSGDGVIATGGGTLIDRANLALVLASGRVGYLRATPETLASRLEGLPRPLLDGHPDRVARLRTLLEERRAAYERAHLAVDTDGRTLDEVTTTLWNWVDHG